MQDPDEIPFNVLVPESFHRDAFITNMFPEDLFSGRGVLPESATDFARHGSQFLPYGKTHCVLSIVVLNSPPAPHQRKSRLKWISRGRDPQNHIQLASPEGSLTEVILGRGGDGGEFRKKSRADNEDPLRPARRKSQRSSPGASWNFHRQPRACCQLRQLGPRKLQEDFETLIACNPF